VQVVDESGDVDEVDGVDESAGVYAQDCDNVGFPPVQPAGKDVETVLDWVLLDWQSAHAE